MDRRSLGASLRLAWAGSAWLGLGLAGSFLGFRFDFGMVSAGFGFWLSFYKDFDWICIDFGFISNGFRLGFRLGFWFDLILGWILILILILSGLILI